MTVVAIEIPVVHKDNWGNFTERGKVTISLDSTSFESYERAKQEANELLEKAGSEYRVIRSLQDLEKQITQRQKELKNLEHSLKRATAKYQKLLTFLGRLGIDGKAYGDVLSISDRPILEASTEVVEDEDDEDEDEDDDYDPSLM